VSGCPGGPPFKVLRKAEGGETRTLRPAPPRTLPGRLATRTPRGAPPAALRAADAVGREATHPRATPGAAHAAAVAGLPGARGVGYSANVSHLRALRDASAAALEARRALDAGASLTAAVRTLRVAAHHVARVEAARRAEAARAHRRSRPECGARCRDGHPCRARVAWSRGDDGHPVEAARCRMHGGASTGPRTAEGRRASLAALARGRETLRQRREAEAARARAEAPAAPG
jgi:hypothetical protein